MIAMHSGKLGQSSSDLKRDRDDKQSRLMESLEEHVNLRQTIKKLKEVLFGAFSC